MVIRKRNTTTKQTTTTTKPTTIVKKDVITESPIIDDMMIMRMKPKFRERFSKLQGLDYESIKKYKYEGLYKEYLIGLEILNVTRGMIISDKYYSMMSYKMVEKYKSLKGLDYNTQILKHKKLLDLYRKCVIHIRCMYNNMDYYEKNKETLQDNRRGVYRAKKMISKTDDPRFT